MGILDRLRKHNISMPLGDADIDKATPEARDAYADRQHYDQLPSFQTNLVRKVSYSDRATRYLRSKADPYGYAHTYGVVDALLYHQPFPFMYVAADTQDYKKAKPLMNMDFIHDKWQHYNLFTLFKEFLAQGSGVGSSWLVRVAENKFVVFNTTHIDGGNYWRNPETKDIEEIWFLWNGAEGGYIGNGKKQPNTSTTPSQMLRVKAIIGVNAVQYTPNFDPDDVFGRSDLLNIWTPMLYKALNGYFSAIYSRKGGISSRVLVAPDDITSTAKNIFKKEALKGIESELIELYYPTAWAKNNISPAQYINWVENKANLPGFSTNDDLYARNSPLPPSFVQGPASGALGGKAPTEDAKRINRFLMSYMSRLQQCIHDINDVFFGIRLKNYMAIPYFFDETPTATTKPTDDSTIDAEDNKDKSDDTAETKNKSDKAMSRRIRKEQSVSSTFTRKELKKHASTNTNIIIYEGNLWESGVYEYEDWFGDKYHENLPADELKKFISDPLSVKEVYFSIEHPYEVNKSNSIGKLQVMSYTETNGVVKDITRIFISSEWDPGYDMIKLSPVYEAYIENRGTIYNGKAIYDQTNISLINAGLVHFPRSELTGKSTTAERQK